MSAPELRHLECCDLSLCLHDIPEGDRLEAFALLISGIATGIDDYCHEEYAERSGVTLNIVGHTYRQLTELAPILARFQIPAGDDVIAHELFVEFMTLVEGYLAGALLTRAHGGLEEAWLDRFRQVMRGAA